MVLKIELINVLFQNTHFIGWETEAQRKVICQLNQCGPRTRRVFPLAAGNPEMAARERGRGCAVPAPGTSLPEELGGSSSWERRTQDTQKPSHSQRGGESSSAAGSILL